MALSTEAELAHARDVTITECQEHLREQALQALEATKAMGIDPRLGAVHATVLRQGADSLENLRGPQPPRVHLLHHGRALCGKDGVPGTWESGHRWVDISLSEAVTCHACKDEARALAGMLVGR